MLSGFILNRGMRFREDVLGQRPADLYLAEKEEHLIKRIANAELKSVLHSKFNCSSFECSFTL